MSLKDMLDEAKREAQEGGSLFFGKDAEGEAKAEGKTEGSTGFSRRSTAKARPVREQASGVRVISAEDAKAGRSGKKTSEMTKEERKADRAARRDEDDLRNSVANILLKQDEAYQHTQRIWWIALGVGFAMTLISFFLTWIVGRDEVVANATYTIISLVSLMLAYVCIIGAFVYDFIKGRPVRRRVDDEVHGMTRKRLETIVREDAEAEAEKRAAKKAK